MFDELEGYEEPVNVDSALEERQQLSVMIGSGSVKCLTAKSLVHKGDRKTRKRLMLRQTDICV
jgi:hypothetical protein